MANPLPPRISLQPIFPPNLNTKSLSEDYASKMRQLEQVLNGVLSTFAGSPWTNPNIPTDAEKAALSELTAGTIGYDNGLLLLTPDGGVLYNPQGEILEKPDQ